MIAQVARASNAATRIAEQRLPSAVANMIANADYALRKFQTRNPQSFMDKIQYKILRDHRPLLATFSDKYAVREYVANAVGPEILATMYGVADCADDLRAFELPRQFVVKATHSCGGVVLVTDNAPFDEPVNRDATGWTYHLVHPDALDFDDLVSLCNHWLENNYGGGPRYEWGYSTIPHRVMVEELLTDPSGAIPADYKFFVFHGEVRIVQVDSDRHGSHRQNLFLPDWTPIAAEIAARPLSPPPQPPSQLAEMLNIASRLGKDTDFVRVDLYAVADRIVFGELTNYLLGGRRGFVPASFDAEVSSWWSPPKRYQ